MSPYELSVEWQGSIEADVMAYLFAIRPDVQTENMALVHKLQLPMGIPK